MHLNSLENVSVNTLTSLFNEAFADYFVKIELTPEILEEKIYSEDVVMNKSAGLFANNKIVGFILHAVRNGVAYNAGTGVIPEFRGQNATVKMYEYILPILIRQEVSEIVLEVIDQNVQAIKSYKKVGFIKDRELFGFKGNLLPTSYNTQVKIEEIENAKIIELQRFWSWQPTWQHATATVQKSNSYKTLGAFLNGNLVGYLTANFTSGRVAQFAIENQHRRQGIATALFYKLAKKCKTEISVINVDGNAHETHKFLEKIGLRHFLTQHKMILNLK